MSEFCTCCDEPLKPLSGARRCECRGPNCPYCGQCAKHCECPLDGHDPRLLQRGGVHPGVSGTWRRGEGMNPKQLEAARWYLAQRKEFIRMRSALNRFEDETLNPAYDYLRDLGIDPGSVVEDAEGQPMLLAATP